MPHKVNGEGFFSQISTLKTVLLDKKSNYRTCTEGCQMPLNWFTIIVFFYLYVEHGMCNIQHCMMLVKTCIMVYGLYNGDDVMKQ